MGLPPRVWRQTGGAWRARICVRAGRGGGRAFPRARSSRRCPAPCMPLRRVGSLRWTPVARTVAARLRPPPPSVRSLVAPRVRVQRACVWDPACRQDPGMPQCYYCLPLLLLLLLPCRTAVIAVIAKSLLLVLLLRLVHTHTLGTESLRSVTRARRGTCLRGSSTHEIQRTRRHRNAKGRGAGGPNLCSSLSFYLKYA